MTMEPISHKIVQSEIDYGILNIRSTDGTKSLVENLPERFTINLRGEIIYNRKIQGRKIWIGFKQMEIFQPDEIVLITRDYDNIVYLT